MLELARSESRAVLTLNRADFIALHNRSSDHAGIIACTDNRDFAGQAGRIDAAISSSAALGTMLLRINRPAK